MTSQCSLELLEAALSGHLPPGDESSLHRHLGECAQCSAALEQLAGGAEWSCEAASLLATDDLDAAVPTRDDWSEVDFSVEHLEPSEDSNALGRLGTYDVLEIIGRGGMGVVLKGFDRELKRCVAIKALAPHLAHSPLAKKRFTREAQAAAAIVHPNVLAIHQVQPNARLPFLVMPLVAGESLAQRLKSRGTLELKEILRIGMQAAAGLAAAHEQGLVHRDVKPANILLEKGVERAVLTDFGLARAADDVSITRLGIIAGTPQYMSPEQARGEPLDGRSDLFSLGCVLYEMATGVSPFRADSALATMRRLVEEPPQALASLNPELPPWFAAIVDRLLEKDPACRFGSAKEVSDLLEGCLAHVQQPTVPLPALATVGRVCDSSQISAQRIKRILRSKGVFIMFATFAAGLLGVFLALPDPPDISGEWTGPEWGQVVLKKITDKEYGGAYTDTFGKEPGDIQLKWSWVEQRFIGTWKEGDDRTGEIAVRLIGAEIRGAFTTDKKSKINPGTPRLSDLTWQRSKAPADGGRADAESFPHRVPFEIGAVLLHDGDRITIDDVRGTAPTIKAGNIYAVHGTYRLASQAKATLSAYITEDGAAESGRFGRPFATPSGPLAQKFASIPTLKGQLMPVERGDGRFRLTFHMSYDGKPHVSFYSEKGDSFAHVYFGTGDSVLKRGWWERGIPKADLIPGDVQVGRWHGVVPRGGHTFATAFAPTIKGAVTDTIDFDSGRHVKIPHFKVNDINEGIATAAAWMERNGMDASFQSGSLLAFGMKVIAIKEGLNVATPEQLASILRSIDPNAPPHVKLNRGETYAIQTREGGQGILQVLDFTDKAEGGLNVRYRMVQRKPLAIEPDAQDPHGIDLKFGFQSCLTCHASVKPVLQNPMNRAGAVEDKSGFTPAIERDLTDVLGVIDLDTGKLIRVPIGEENWMAKYRMDAAFVSDGLFTWDMKVALTKDMYWEQSTPTQLAGALRAIDPKATQNFEMKRGRTYIFETREGTQGILQVLASTGDADNRFKLRYKVALQKKARAIEPNAADPHQFGVKAGFVDCWSCHSPGNRAAVEATPGFSATKEQIEIITALLKDAPVTTAYLAELFELTPGSKSEYRMRSDVVSRPILPAAKGPLNFVPLGTVLHLPPSKRFYVQWDAIGVSTRHYYGPFYGDPEVTLGLVAGHQPTGVRFRKNAAVRLHNITAVDAAAAVKNFIAKKRAVQAIQGSAPSDEDKVVAVAEPISNTLLVSALPQHMVEILEMVRHLDAAGPPLSATKEQVENLAALLKKAPVTTAYLAELFELTPGSKSEYRMRSDVVVRPIFPAVPASEPGSIQPVHVPAKANSENRFTTTKQPANFIPLGNVLYLPASKMFYVQWDGIGAGTLHYYGPFYGEPGVTLGLEVAPRQAEEKQEKSDPAKIVSGLTPAGRLTPNLDADSGVRFRLSLSGKPSALAYSPDGKALAVGEAWGTIRLLDPKTGDTIRSLRVLSKDEEIFVLVYSPDGRTLAVGNTAGQVRLVDAQTGAILHSLIATPTAPTKGDDDSIEAGPALPARPPRAHNWISRYGIAFYPNGTGLVTGGSPVTDDPEQRESAESPLLHWEVKTGKRTGALTGLLGSVGAVAISADHKIIAGAGHVSKINERGVLIVHPEKQLLKTVRANIDNGSIAFSPDGIRLAFGHNPHRADDRGGHRISVIDSETGATTVSWQTPHSVAGFPIAYSNDGKWIVAFHCQDDQSQPTGVNLWEAATGRLVHKVGGDNGDSLEGFALSPLGDAVAVYGIDAELRTAFIEVRNLDGGARR